MTFGFQVTNSSGTVVVSPTSSAGGLFIQAITQAAGTSQTYTFSNVPGGSNLRVIQTIPGGHSYVIGTDGSGFATITLTALTSGFIVFTNTTLVVFSTYTTETNTFGILTVNDAGERIISGTYKTPQFLQKINASSWSLVNNGAILNPSSYNWYSASITIPAVSSARQRYILFSLPNGNDTWFTFDDTYLPSSFTSSSAINADVFSSVTPVMPDVYVFALDGATASTTGYGIQMRDSSGNVTFDSNAANMYISNIAQNVSFPIGSGSEPIGTVKTFTSAYTNSSPVSVVPQYFQTRLSRKGPVQTNEDYYYGGSRRNGSSFETQLFYVYRMIGDYTGPLSPSTYGQGNYNNLYVPSLSSTLY